MKLYDWHKMLDDFKNAIGGLPNYKRSVVWEYVKAKDERIAELEKDINEVANSNVQLREAVEEAYDRGVRDEHSRQGMYPGHGDMGG